MCTMIVENVKINGSGKVNNDWITLDQANVSYDHPSFDDGIAEFHLHFLFF